MAGIGPRQSKSDSRSVAFRGSVSDQLPDETSPLLRANISSPYRSTQSAPHSPTDQSRSVPKLRSSRSFHSLASSKYATTNLETKESIWYDNYTAIDWNRDYILDNQRRDRLRKAKGPHRRAVYLLDAIQGWILCFLIGILTALVAYLIMLSEVLLSSLKSGYCQTSFFTSQKACGIDGFKYWASETSSQFVIYLLFATAFATTASLLTMTTITKFPSGRTLYMAAGSGIPEVKTILGGFIIHGFLGLRTFFVKAVGLTLAVATDMNLGKEGPFVHIASCIANILTRYFPKFANNESKKREVLSSACSAGVAVAFGSPIGGVLFALEEVSYYFPPKVMWRSFFCAAVAAVVLKVLNPLGTGKLVLLETAYERIWHVRELPVFILIGILGGLYGAAFCTLNIAWAKRFRSISIVVQHPILEVIAVCLLSTAVSYWNEFTRLGGTELVDALLSECSDQIPSRLCPGSLDDYNSIINSLTIALFLKAILTVVTFGIKIPAGIFIPTMCVGALYGRIIGLSLQQLYVIHPSSWVFGGLCNSKADDCIVPGIYAMLGAAATLAGVTRMTVSLAVIMLELTASLGYVMPYMITILTAKWVAEAFQPKGIYDLIIDLNEHPYLDIKQTPTYGKTCLVDLLPPRTNRSRSTIDVTCNTAIKSSELASKLHWIQNQEYEDGGFAIIRDDQLIGYMALSDVSLGLDLIGMVSTMDQDIVVDPSACTVSEAGCDTFGEDLTAQLYANQTSRRTIVDFGAIIERAPLAVSKETSMEMVVDLFAKLGLRYLAVLDGSNFLGTIHKKRFVAFLKKTR